MTETTSNTTILSIWTKKSLEWERECQVQFLTQVLPQQGSINTILTKESLVNFISAKKNLVPRVSGHIKEVLVKALERTATPLKATVYSRENYYQIFRSGIVESPVETIRMGQNQFVRMCPPDRHTRTVESIVILRDGENIAVSLHNKGIDRFVGQIKTADEIIYIDKNVSQAAMLFSKDGDSQVWKEDENLLSGLEQKFSPLNSNYDETKILSIQPLADSGALTLGRLDITKIRKCADLPENTSISLQRTKLTESI